MMLAILASSTLAFDTVYLDSSVMRVDELFLRLVKRAEPPRACTCAVLVEYAAIVELARREKVTGFLCFAHSSSPA